MTEFLECFNLLKKILTDKAYLNIEAQKRNFKSNKALIFKMAYGTLDYNQQISMDIARYVKNIFELDSYVLIVLKQAIYALKYLDSLPDYAVVNNSILLLEKIKKYKYKSLVNAVLRSFLRNEKPVIFKNEIDKMSYELSVAPFIIKKLSKYYKSADIYNIFKKYNDFYETVRINKLKYNDEKFADFLSLNAIKYRKVRNIYQISNTEKLNKLFNDGYITYQSLSSVLAVETLGVKDNENVLDLCAAPGGKSVLISEMADCNLTACDIHPHRLELIEKYSQRMGSSKFKIKLNDARIINEEFLSKFDKVLVDSPCLGLGVIYKKPDILLKLKEDDIQSMSDMQKCILDNALNYVKVGGVLVYSTCSLFKEENDDVVQYVLSRNKNFILDETFKPKTIIPDDNNRDGFYIAKLKRIQ